MFVMACSIQCKNKCINSSIKFFLSSICNRTHKGRILLLHLVSITRFYVFISSLDGFPGHFHTMNGNVISIIKTNNTHIDHTFHGRFHGIGQGRSTI